MTIKVCLETKEGTIIEICTCRNEENVIRKIVQGYEDIWQNTINRPVDVPAEEYGSSTNPIINNWGGSEILVESIEDPGEFDKFYL
jgi:hypothetical protein|tara:strand:- start:258 stop:515 length:258 start_codon:yes stop_codon:yes gene_type:complete